MKRRMNIMLVAILVMLGALIAISLRGQNAPIVSVAAPAGAPAMPAVGMQVQPLPPVVQLSAAPAPAPVEQAQRSVPASVEAAPAAAPAVPAQQADANPAPKWGAGEKLGYTAVEGDTLSNVVGGLRGSDTKKNRDAVIAANPSLQADPDRVLAGKTYLLTAPPAVAAAPASPEIQALPIPDAKPEVAEAAQPKSDRVLKYTAQPGDSVSALAAGLLGEDSKTNRDAIINHNQSLKNDPDHIVAGKTYKIPAGDGLSAAAAPAAANVPPATTQPDADGVVKIGAGRELRYTARAGDSVSKLAEALLGSDTPANRDAIINNNASLKSDPDRVVAGQTYWIPAPVASIEQP
jgi:hypothetical protein